MLVETNIYIVIFGIISFLVFVKGLYEVLNKHNPFGETYLLCWLGIFVWGDAVILGVFWFLVSLISYILNDPVLFLLIVSVFWMVRSFGEIIYWMSQQFSTINRNPPYRLKGFHLFKNDSIWFIYQLIWQCLLVISTVTTISLVHLWTTI